MDDEIKKKSTYADLAAENLSVKAENVKIKARVKSLEAALRTRDAELATASKNRRRRVMDPNSKNPFERPWDGR
jgi:beta-phosphoglucomutase-like phosphatase (HAD superfamily)